MAPSHVRVPTEECHHDEIPVFHGKSRCRKPGMCGIVLGSLFVAVSVVLILLGTSTPAGAALKALIVKVSSDVSVQRFLPRRRPLRGTATGLCTNGKFKNSPRIRKEWRELSSDELRAVQEAFWRLRGYKPGTGGAVNKAGFEKDDKWDTTVKGQAECAKLNVGVPAADQNPYCGWVRIVF